jgi:riboflavin kinase / FMN adenylyltransferase
MQLFRSLVEARALPRGSAVAIGNFDGVHLGHRRLFELVRGHARSTHPAVALTFDPHPVRVLRPGLAPPLITPLPRKLELFAEVGLDAAVVQPFDLAYARADAAEFVLRDLARNLGASEVVVGQDFTAGRGRSGVEELRPLLAKEGIALTIVEKVASEGLVVSSTKIRELLLEGHVEGACQLLGRAHDVDGLVHRGAGRGKSFGFGTANIAPEAMLPANGVYAVRAAVGGKVYGGVCNVGVKPTVQEAGPVECETHLFDFDGRDLYGEGLRVAFLGRLREERRYPTLDALLAQIARDVERAKAVLDRTGPV